jgi:hypothetical protein
MRHLRDRFRRQDHLRSVNHAPRVPGTPGKALRDPPPSGRTSRTGIGPPNRTYSHTACGRLWRLAAAVAAAGSVGGPDARVQRGPERARGERVDRDPGAGQLDGQAAGELDNGAPCWRRTRTGRRRRPGRARWPWSGCGRTRRRVGAAAARQASQVPATLTSRQVRSAATPSWPKVPRAWIRARVSN